MRSKPLIADALTGVRHNDREYECSELRARRLESENVLAILNEEVGARELDIQELSPSAVSAPAMVGTASGAAKPAAPLAHQCFGADAAVSA